ncbi:hypothetical protein ABK040_001207 [Willaertia magna]
MPIQKQNLNHHRYSPYPSNHNAPINNNNKRLEVRYNSSGYRQYKVSNSSSNLNNSNNNVNNEGNDYNNNGWKYTHRRVAEKIVGRNLLSSEQVHHINKNKTDNRRNNLAVIDRDIHGYLHQSEKLEQKACFRCGHTSHYASDCFAKRDVFDRTIVGGSKSTVYYNNYNNNSDSEGNDSDESCCSRCGRSSHTSSNCYAKYDVDGNYIY